MIKSFNIVSVVMALILTGCASTVTTSGNAGLKLPAADTHKLVMAIKGNGETSANTDWQQFRVEWNKQMAGVATINGLDYRYLADDTLPGMENATLVAITVNDYRYITATSRVLVGVMTGNAWLDVDVEYRDLSSGTVVGKRNYQTKSTAWQGAFSAMTEKQIESVCTEIVGEIVKNKAPFSTVSNETVHKAESPTATLADTASGSVVRN